MSQRVQARAVVREARHAAYREIVFAAAESVFADRGFEATKIQDIAERAGLSVGVIYDVYAGKLEIFSAIHEERGNQLLKLSLKAIEGGLAPRELLLAGVRITVEFFAEHPAYLRMHLHESTAWSYPQLTTPVQATAWEQAYDLLCAMFRAGMDDGSFVPGDPEVAARVLMAVNQTYLAAWARGGMRDAPDAVIEQMQAFAQRAFCAGATTPPSKSNSKSRSRSGTS